MIGVHLMTVSPSSSSSRRSTPWVEGCCGPMLMIIVSWRISPVRASTAGASGVLGVVGASAIGPQVVVRVSTGGMNAPWKRVFTPPSASVFSSGWPLPALGQQQRPGVGMTVEHDAVEVVRLALVPVRRREQRGHARHVRVGCREADLHPQPVVLLDREQLVGHPEPRIGLGPVGRGEARAEPQREAGVIAQPREHAEQVVTIDDGGHLAAGHRDVGTALAHALGQLGGLHLNGSVVRTFSCSFRMPCISISGFGGHPGTYTSTGTIVSTPCTIA